MDSIGREFGRVVNGVGRNRLLRSRPLRTVRVTPSAVAARLLVEEGRVEVSLAAGAEATYQHVSNKPLDSPRMENELRISAEPQKLLAS